MTEDQASPDKNPDPGREENPPLAKIEKTEEERASADSKPPKVPTRPEILSKLALMPGLIASGFLPPAKANAMRGTYQTLLNGLDDRTPDGSPAITDELTLQLLREQPHLLKLAAPFFSDEQLKLIMHEAPKE